MSAKLKIEDFLFKSNLIHNNKFSYDKVVLINTKCKVIIECPYHGEFKQTPNEHMSGNGCPNCRKNKKLNTESFINRSIKKHGNIFDYSKVEYTISSEKVIIICSKHGEFKQLANDHLCGSGCPMCAKILRSETQLKSTEQFLLDCYKVHGDVYGYDKVFYNGAHKKIIITCNTHGFFTQKPSDHLNGSGCPSCSISGYKNFIKGYLYIQYVNDDVYKIGITNNPIKRLISINRSSIFEHKYVRLFSSDDGKLIYTIEQKILQEIPTGVVEKVEMQNGYTETFSKQYIDKVLQIIEGYKLQEENI